MAQCNKPFISEIVFSKDSVSISGTSNIPNSYALEIFNPKDSVLNLTGYYLKLIDVRDEEIIINLNGVIPSKGKFVVAFSQSDTALLNLSDFFSNQLNYNEKIRLEFGDNDGIIDKIGSSTLSAADSINIAAAIADPENYLNSLNINLSTLKNFTFRRKSTITGGDSAFANVAQNWSVAQNGDISNVGLHNSVCVVDDVTYEFFIGGSVSLAEGFNFLVQIKANGITDATATHSVDVTPIFTTTECISIFNTLPFADCADVNMNSNNNCNTYTAEFDTPGAWVKSFYLVPKVDNIIEGPEIFSITLSNPVGGIITADTYYSCRDITIGASTSISNSAQNIGIKAFPNPFNETINILNFSQKQIDNIEMIDMLGKKIFAKNGNTKTIETFDLQNGIYFIKYTINNNIYFEKVVKN